MEVYIERNTISKTSTKSYHLQLHDGLEETSTQTNRYINTCKNIYKNFTKKLSLLVIFPWKKEHLHNQTNKHNCKNKKQKFKKIVTQKLHEKNVNTCTFPVEMNTCTKKNTKKKK